MNQLLPDTSYCACGTGQLNHPILKITAGNDFSILIQITEKVDGEWVHYDMTDMLNVQVSVNSPNNTPNDIEHIIDEDGNIVAIVDAQQFRSYIPYALEVVWQEEQDEDTIDHRAYASDVFMFVNSSMEATDSSYDYTSDSPYEYNIRMSNDLAILSIGHIPDVDLSYYYTKDEIDETLLAYVTHDYLSSQSYLTSTDLDGYVTDTSLATTLSSYATNDSVDNKIQLLWTDAVNTFVDDDELQEAISHVTVDLSSYVTYNYLSDQSYVTSTELTNAGYVTSTELTNAGYVTASDLSNMSYVTSTELTNAGYVTASDLSNMSYVTSSDLSSMGYITLNDIPTVDLSSYVTYAYLDERLADLPSGDVDLSAYITYTELDNYTYAISSALIDHERDIYYTYSYFNNYYDKSQSDSKYVTSSQVSAKYVDYDSLNNLAYGTSSALNDLNDRVTYIETYGGSGGGGDIDLSAYVKQTTLDTTLASYVTYTYWDNTNEAIAYEFVNNRLEHLAINNNFSYYYTKTETDGRYATQSWANNKFVPQTDDVNRQEAIAAAFSYTVMSDTIHNIWRGSQSDYDLLTPDADTLYIII